MNELALTENRNYCRGRTHEEHRTWLDALAPDSDEYRIVHMPIGHLFNLAMVSHLKRKLLNHQTTADVRLKVLDAIESCACGPVNMPAIAVIEPCCDVGEAMMTEINSLPVEKQTRAFNDGDVFRLLAKLNPSLLRALDICEGARGKSPQLQG